jgi:hypothetical protein
MSDAILDGGLSYEMADPPSELHKVTSITTTDYLDAMPTPSAGIGVLVVSK